MRIEEHFQRLSIWLGYAVKCMPCLKGLNFGFEETYEVSNLAAQLKYTSWAS